MGYQDITVYDSKTSFAYNKQCRLLLSGAQVTQLHLIKIFHCTVYLNLFCVVSLKFLLCVLQNKLLPIVMSPDLNSYKDMELQEEGRKETHLSPLLFFRTPRNVLNPQIAHPLRIFVNNCFYISSISINQCQIMQCMFTLLVY